MKPKFLRFCGVFFLILGILGFLFASVGLASADKVTDIQAPSGMHLALDANDPQVHARKHQAEAVLFASLLVGEAGIGLFVAGLVLGRRKIGLAGTGVHGR